MNTKPLILVVDDERAILDTLKEILEDENYRVETLSDGNKTIEHIGKLIPDLVLLDIFMPNCNGMDLLKQIQQEYPNQKVIMISGFGNISIAIESVKNGALNFIEKPLNIDEILNKISFLKMKKNSKINKSLIKNNSKKEIIGNSYLFLELLQQINQILNINFPLIIYGQHGTGKSLFAEYIHKNGYLKNEKFSTINCSNSLEKEIIKNITKSFSNKKGTIYIKHINNLPQNAQKILLDNLENNIDKEIRVIVSSTTQLFKLVQTNQFNSSLYHKINITPLEIPALNKRKYDIPLLINHFLKIENEKNKKSIKLTTKAIRMLRNYKWHGNVTELKSLIKQIVLQTSDANSIIDIQNIILFLDEKKAQIIEEQSFTHFNSLKEATSEFEKTFLTYLLKKNRYDIKQTSDNLQLSTIELKNKLLKFKIDVK